MNKDITAGYYPHHYNNKSKNDNVVKTLSDGSLAGDYSLEALCTMFSSSKSSSMQEENNYFDCWSPPQQQERAQTSTGETNTNNDERLNGFIDLKKSSNGETDRILVNIKSTSSSLSIISASAVANNSTTHSPVVVEDWKESSNASETKIPVVQKNFISKNNVGLMDDESAFYSNQSIPWNVDHGERPAATMEDFLFIETVLFSKGGLWNDDKNVMNDNITSGVPARDTKSRFEYDNSDDERSGTHHHFTSFRERYKKNKAGGKNFTSTNRNKAAFSKADVVMDDYELYRFRR